jgi:hypothetical protein
MGVCVQLMTRLAYGEKAIVRLGEGRFVLARRLEALGIRDMLKSVLVMLVAGIAVGTLLNLALGLFM